MQGTDRGRYSCRTLNGNWYEESVREDEKIREFLEKKERGELLIQTIGQNTTTVKMVKPEEMPKDGYLHFGMMVRIKNDELGCFVACDPSDLENEEEKLYSCTGSKQSDFLARNVWILKKFEENDFLQLPEDEGEEDIVHYGDKFYLSTTDQIGSSPFYLASTQSDFMHYSRISRKQMIYSTQQESYKCTWRICCLNPNDDFDMEGEPVKINSPVIIKHNQTGSPLAVRDCQILNDYGSEYELVGAREPGRKMVWRFV
ncbi:cilia- and flagella-associated protein [Histomonas meleagridis]|uniref:cilia- and flagella-associated protein n=1 Tax=Histomonas meleagridis TaxID=135588 RepID=UPI00355A9DF5|nr:cilia- and flagella-associated protein [Histomonas meleagridis]KAH0803466.1 cilia- and flagella-associated protein [Histomonas meleagridis]